MDDLASVDWLEPAPPAPPTRPTQSAVPGGPSVVVAAAPTGKPSPLTLAPTPTPTPPPPAPLLPGSGRNTPLPLPVQGSRPAVAIDKDGFARLIHTFGPASKTTATKLSLRERQEQLEAERRSRQQAQSGATEAKFGSANDLDLLGLGSPALAELKGRPSEVQETDQDLFAAFRADTTVDTSSHFPPPATAARVFSPSPGRGPPTSSSREPAVAAGGPNAHDDDDPFGLGLGLAGSGGSPRPAASASESPGLGPPSSSAPREPPVATGGLDAGDDDPFGLGLGLDVGGSGRLPRPTSAAAGSSQPPGPGLSGSSAWEPPLAAAGLDAEDDDPSGLGLNLVGSGRSPQPTAAAAGRSRPPGPTSSTWEPPVGRGDVDTGRDKPFGQDVLRDPGQPVSRIRPNTHPNPDNTTGPADGAGQLGNGGSTPDGAHPNGLAASFDNAVAQLVGYGFTPDNARRGLTENPVSVIDVQAAANWLLDDADQRAKEKAGGRSRGRERHHQPFQHDTGTAREESRDSHLSNSGGDASHTAAAAAAAAGSSNLLKAANSMWKTGKKNLQRAMADLQPAEADPGQPKWMRPERPSGRQPGGGGSAGRGVRDSSFTDEAMMLESGVRHGAARPRDDPDSASSYVSPHRRRTPQPEREQPRSRLGMATVPKPDLLLGGGGAPEPSLQSQRSVKPASRSASQVRPVPARETPPIPAREIPPLPQAVSRASTRHRLEGAAHLRRGDYSAAHEAYTVSLVDVPPTHPLTIVLLTRRALTELKSGAPRLAVEDADKALRVIGLGGGAPGETISIPAADHADENETHKISDLYGEALSHKAEALEQLERWADARMVWQLCVESGVAGPAAARGRQRCQAALAPKPAVSAATTAPRASPKPVAVAHKLEGMAAASSAAVEQLRRANEEAARRDNEKLELADAVAGRVSAWRSGRADNLRALLSHLDTIMWPGSGWSKPELQEMVDPKRAKVVYMRAITKTHPDKLPQDANAEVQLIAASVFSTLNECWDRFRAENNM